MKEKKRKQIAFEIHKQNNLLPKLNLPLNLKTEKARQSPTEHSIKEVNVLQAVKPTFLAFLSEYTRPLRHLCVASNLS